MEDFPTASAEPVVRAFPAALADDVRRVVAALPRARPEPLHPFEVDVLGETVAVPARLHWEEPDAEVVRSLTGTGRAVLHCLYSRHGDGRVRQRHLERVLEVDEAWAVPFVVQPVGEYVAEIVATIRRGLPDVESPGRRALYGEFVVGNPAFFARTERRAASYWNRYHRRSWPTFGEYPGSAVLAAWRAAASDVAGVSWPRAAPRPHRGSLVR